MGRIRPLLAASVLCLLCLISTCLGARVNERLTEGQSPNLGESMFVVPVMEPETQMNTFSGLNPHPDLPAVIAPGTNMGTRPFYAMAGIGVMPGGGGGGSFFFKQVGKGAKVHKMKRVKIYRSSHTPSFIETEDQSSESSECPKGWSMQGMSDEVPRCQPNMERPHFVVPMPKFSPAAWDPNFPGYNPAFPPVSMPGAVQGVAQPAMAIIPKKGKK